MPECTLCGGEPAYTTVTTDPGLPQHMRVQGRVCSSCVEILEDTETDVCAWCGGKTSAKPQVTSGRVPRLLNGVLCIDCLGGDD